MKKLGVGVSLGSTVFVGVDWLKKFQLGLDPLNQYEVSKSLTLIVNRPDSDTFASKKTLSSPESIKWKIRRWYISPGIDTQKVV